MFKFLRILSLFLGGALPAGAADATNAPSIKAVAFDAFPIFDPRPVESAALALYPEKGAELTRLWRLRQFEYQWLRALGDKYEDFLSVTDDALTFAARQLDIALTEENRRRLMAPYSELKPWPDAADALKKLKARGYKVVFLTNMTDEMIRSGLAGSGLSPLVDAIYSTDAIRSYKPAPAAYRLASHHLGLSREEILFVAFAGWDVAGAKWFGYPTFWVNRTGALPEELGVSPDGIGPDLSSLLQFLDRSRSPGTVSEK